MKAYCLDGPAAGDMVTMREDATRFAVFMNPERAGADADAEREIVSIDYCSLEWRAETDERARFAVMTKAGRRKFHDEMWRRAGMPAVMSFVPLPPVDRAELLRRYLAGVRSIEELEPDLCARRDRNKKFRRIGFAALWVSFITLLAMAAMIAAGS